MMNILKNKEIIRTNKVIIIINGSGGCGKSTFCKLCGKYIPAKEISTVDKIKEAFKLIGWDGKTKTEDIRMGLSNLKDCSTKLFNHPYSYIKNQIYDFLYNNSKENLLFINSREPEEIKRFVKEFKCITVHIVNPNIKVITSNHADAETDNYRYDYTIINNGTLNDFENQAKKFMKGGIKIEPETNIEQRLKCRYKYYDDEGVSCSKKPIVYLSHIYKGLQSNADEVAMVMLKLVKRYPNLNFFSPIHNFPFYDDLDYSTGLQKCIDFLPYCDFMLVIGNWRDSKGCTAEIEFCKKHNIPIKFCTVKEVMNG